MRRDIWLLAIIIILGVALRVAVLVFIAPFYPPIDVYVVDQQAPRTILNLQNPYDYIFSVHHYTLTTFAYLPMVSIYYIPFLVLGDIRYGNIFADVIIMLALYWIAKSFNCKTAVYSSFAFAVFPISLWLTSGAATNMMIGTAFIMLSLAMLLQKRFLFSSVLLGLAVASNQLVALTFPLFGYYFWRQGKFKAFLPSLLTATAITLPFFLLSPSKFIYSTILFQFVRPLQADGRYSLYSIIATSLHVQLNTIIRVILFIVPYLLMAFWSRQRRDLFVLSIGVILFWAAFVLPIDGLYNYFLPSLAVGCLVFPFFGDWVDRKMQDDKLWPHFFDD